jgi:hypothetical protein
LLSLSVIKEASERESDSNEEEKEEDIEAQFLRELKLNL